MKQVNLANALKTRFLYSGKVTALLNLLKEQEDGTVVILDNIRISSKDICKIFEEHSSRLVFKTNGLTAYDRVLQNVINNNEAVEEFKQMERFDLAPYMKPYYDSHEELKEIIDLVLENRDKAIVVSTNKMNLKTWESSAVILTLLLTGKGYEDIVIVPGQDLTKLVFSKILFHLGGWDMKLEEYVYEAYDKSFLKHRVQEAPNGTVYIETAEGRLVSGQAESNPLLVPASVFDGKNTTLREMENRVKLVKTILTKKNSSTVNSSLLSNLEMR